MKKVIISVTTAADGTGTGTGTETVDGLLWSIEYVKTDYADGVDVTINAAGAEGADQKVVFTNLNAAATLAPRMDRCKTDGTALSANDVLIPFVGRPQVVIAQGGNAKSGKFIFTFLD